ncbi:MAG: DUF3244 domain-containing protein [Paludibacteraceae bacterium]|nr:DUF3244 domain-containing protein [Paludibacteraceae bacterium]
MKKTIIFTVSLFFSLFFIQLSFAEDVPLKSSHVSGALNSGFTRTRVYIPLTASFESAELGLFFESNVGMCNVSIEDENGNVQMSEIIDTDNESEFWFDLSSLSSGLHYVKISYGSLNLVGEFYVE